MLQQLANAGMPGLHRESARTQCTVLCNKMSRCLGAGLSDVAEIVSRVAAGCWEPDLKQELCRAAAQIGTGGCEVPKPNATQSFDVVGYVTQDLMRNLHRCALGRKSLEILAKHLLELGLTKPSEKSMQKCVAAFLLMTVGADEAKRMSPASLFQVLCDFKIVLKSLKVIAPPETPLYEYPHLALEFKVMRPKTFDSVFANSDPIFPVPDIFESAVALAAIIPLRRTKRMAVDSPAFMTPCSKSPKSSMDAMMPFVALLQAVQQATAVQTPVAKARSEIPIFFNEKQPTHEKDDEIASQTLQQASLPDGVGQLSLADSSPTHAALPQKAQLMLQPVEADPKKIVDRTKQAVASALEKRKLAPPAEEADDPPCPILKKRPAAAATVPHKCRPEIPDAMERKTILYRKGKILVHPEKKHFRCFRDTSKSPNGNDRRIKWGDDIASAWDRACRLLEDA